MTNEVFFKTEKMTSTSQSKSKFNNNDSEQRQQKISSFTEISKKVLRANYSSALLSSNVDNKKRQQPDLRQLVEVLLATNLNTDNTFEKDLLELLLSGCQTINCTDEQLTSRFSKIIFNFTNKRMVSKFSNNR